MAAGPIPGSEHVLRSRDDFQRFCAGFRKASHDLDDLVEALRALAASSLRSRDKGRFARSIARQLSESFHAAEVRAVASVPWPPEIAMAIRSHVVPQGEPEPQPAPLAPLPDSDPRELTVELGKPTVVLLGDEDEHRHSIEHLSALGFRCERHRSTEQLQEVFARELVVGLVVGSSFWSLPDVQGTSPVKRLAHVLRTSNLCWTKLIRSAAWASVQEQLPDLCTSLYFREPPMTRLVVEDQSAISKLEMRCLTDAAHDILYAERKVEYGFQPSILQDRIIRAVTSRYLRDRFPTVHEHEAGLRVRPLANRGAQGLVALVSTIGSEVSFVVKVSDYEDAMDEARRFRMFAPGASFDMEFFCHAMLGALVFAPVDTRLGQARSLENVLGDHELAEVAPHEGRSARTDLIDSAIAALLRFCGQTLPPRVTTYCNLEAEHTPKVLEACGDLVVAGQPVDVARLYQQGVEVLDRGSNAAIVHGDAHPGNILFSATNSAVLIDYECAGLGPACLDLCTLWIFALASHFVAVQDEQTTTALLRDLLRGVSLEQLVRSWPQVLRFAANYELLYLARKAIDASVQVMSERGFDRRDVYGIVAVILGRELLNPQLQQFVVRCGLAATQAVLADPPA